MRPHQPTVLSLGAMALAFVSGIRDANAIQIRNCGFRESAISDAYTRAIALTAQAWKDLLDSPQTRAATSPRYLKAMLAYDSNEYWTFTDNTSTIEANLLTSNFTFDCSPPKGVCTSDEVYLDPMDQSHTMYLCNTPTSFFSLSSEEQAASIAARITQFQDVLGTQRGSFNRGLQYEYSYQVFIAATGNTDARMGPWTPMSARPSIEQYTATVLVPANGTATAIAECPIGPGITIKPYEPVLGAVWTVSSSDIHVYSSHAKAENFNNWDNNWEVKAYNTSSTVGTLTVTANCLSSNLGIKPTTGSNSGTTTKGSVTVTAPCPLGSISTGSGFSLLDATNTSAPALNAAITSLDIGSVRATITSGTKSIKLTTYLQCLPNTSVTYASPWSPYVKSNGESWSACPTGAIATSALFSVVLTSAAYPVPLSLTTAREYGTEDSWGYFKGSISTGVDAKAISGGVQCIKFK